MLTLLRDPARRRRGLIGASWVFTVVAIAGSLLLWLIRGLPPLPLSFMHGPGANVGVGLLGFTYVTVGALLAWRRPDNVIGWLFLLTGFLLGLAIPLNLLVAESVHTFRPIPTPTLLLAWGISSFDAPMAAGTAFIVAVVFPGRRAPGRWHRLVFVQALAFFLVGLASALNPGGLIWFPTLPNPLLLPERLDPAIHFLQAAALALAVLSMVGTAISLPVRYRDADPHLRRQLRWIMAAIAVLPFTTAPLFLARYAMGATYETGDLLMVVASVGGCAFPIAVAIAIMRHHLFGIDRLVERAFVYVPLTAILAGLYAASVALFQRIFVQVTGTGNSEAAAVLSTLILASTFTPVRQALERMAERRFNPKHAGAAALVKARIVGEPSMVPVGSVMVDMPTEAAAPPSPAFARRGGSIDERAAAGEDVGAAPVRAGVPATTEAVVTALSVISERLSAIEERIARLEEEHDEDALLGPAAVDARAAPDAGAPKDETAGAATDARAENEPALDARLAAFRKRDAGAKGDAGAEGLPATQAARLGS